VKNLCSIGGYFFTSLALALLMVGVLGMPSNVLADPGDPATITLGEFCKNVKVEPGGCVELGKACIVPGSGKRGTCIPPLNPKLCDCIPVN